MNRRSILAAAALLTTAIHAAIHAPATARAEAIAVVGGTVHTMTGASITPASTSALASQSWPVSKASISGRTPSAWIWRAISISVSWVLVAT